MRFRTLTEDDLAVIVGIQLGRLRTRLAERRLSLEVTDEAEALLARKGYDPDFGARPLRRVIQREVEDQLALAMLGGALPGGLDGGGRPEGRRHRPAVGGPPDASRQNLREAGGFKWWTRRACRIVPPEYPM